LSAYRTELLAALVRGATPVLIELADDRFDRGRTVVVDHHGPLAGHDRPASIEQVFALLGLPTEAWTRRLALVAANGRAHIARSAAWSGNAADRQAPLQFGCWAV
jgi:hypothetical protein